MIFVSLSLSLPSQLVNPGKNEPINGVTNTYTPVNALCMFMYTTHFQQKCPKTMIQSTINLILLLLNIDDAYKNHCT
jgi:hypothetical protein